MNITSVCNTNYTLPSINMLRYMHNNKTFNNAVLLQVQFMQSCIFNNLS